MTVKGPQDTVGARGEGAPDARFLAKPPPTTSLGPAKFTPDAAPIFEEAIDALESAGVEFLLGGAFALNAYTDIWRDTKDLDAFVRPRDVSRAMDALERARFDAGIVYPSWLGKGWKGDVFVDVIWRNANGLFPVTDEWFAHAGEGEIFGRPIPVLPLEELILSKIMVGGRFRWDGADLLHLFFVQGDKIDWSRLEREVGEHAGLLVGYLHMYRWAYPAWSDRVPDEVIERLHERSRQAAREPSDPFRGTLLDIPTFRVDVDEWGLPDPHKATLRRIAHGTETGAGMGPAHREEGAPGKEGV